MLCDWLGFRLWVGGFGYVFRWFRLHFDFAQCKRSITWGVFPALCLWFRLRVPVVSATFRLRSMQALNHLGDCFRLCAPVISAPLNHLLCTQVAERSRSHHSRVPKSLQQRVKATTANLNFCHYFVFFCNF
jgi:hypothetical protein